MQEQSRSPVDAQAFRDLVQDIPFAMFTTAMADGTLRSRPMVAHADAFDGALWFFTRTSSAVTSEIGAHPHVNVVYVSAPEDRFVSVSGRAVIVHDADRAARMWVRDYATWFPGGPADPDLSMIRIDVARVEHWDAKTGHMRQL